MLNKSTPSSSLKPLVNVLLSIRSWIRYFQELSSMKMDLKKKMGRIPPDDESSYEAEENL